MIRAPARLRHVAPALFTAALLPATLAAQVPHWIVRDSAIPAEGADLPLVEPHPAVSPWDARHVVVGAIAVAADRTEGPWRCAAYTTEDGGGAWRRHDFPIDRCIDPWVVFADSTTVLFSATEITRDGTGDRRFRLVLFRSDNGGRTWSDAPEVLGRTHEHAQIVRQSDGTLWLTARITLDDGAGEHALLVAVSGDAGRTFRTVLRHVAGGSNLMVTGITATNDTAIVAYRHSPGDTSSRVEHARSLRITPAGAPGGPVPIGICTNGDEDVFAGYPAFAHDRARAILYHACIRAGLAGVDVFRSTDGGQSWTGPVRADARSPTPHARTAMISVDADGHVAVAWYDRRADPERACQAPWIALSLDGARTFGIPVRVATADSCPAGPANGGVADAWAMGGDYGSLTAAPDGTFRLVWADSRTGPFRLRTSVFGVR